MPSDAYKHRSSIRLSGFDYSSVGGYFVTICTRNREDIFGTIIDSAMRLNAFGKIVEEEWIACCKAYPDARIGNYIIMPDHFHGIVFFVKKGRAIRESPLRRNKSCYLSPNNLSPISIDKCVRRQMLLPKLIGRFKMASSKRINLIRRTPGMPVWQRNYYEHIIRNETELNELSEYIVSNPERRQNRQA